VPLRTRIARTVLAAAIAIVALASVGLTAPASSPFTIDVEPVFMRLDPASIAESRAHALAVKVDVKVGNLHLHYRWSAIPLTPVTTKPGSTLL
jgi:hypothetical protein